MNAPWTQALSMVPMLVEMAQNSPTVDGVVLSGADKKAYVAKAILSAVPQVAPFMFIINMAIDAAVAFYKNKHPAFVAPPPAAPAAVPPSATSSFQAQFGAGAPATFGS